MKARLVLQGAVLAAAIGCAAALAAPPDDAQAGLEQARRRWEESPHGPMLERILPPTFAPAQLPEPDSRGAQLVAHYCVQCHNLANPAMHDARKWPRVVERMVLRMRGKGNLGAVMQDMMAGVAAPDDEEAQQIVAYLRRNAQRPIDAAKYPDLDRPEGRAFKLACQQCHTLPDPKRHTAKEWSAVVERMQENMTWMNRVVGTHPDPDEPQLRIDEINEFLARHARAG